MRVLTMGTNLVYSRIRRGPMQARIVLMIVILGWCFPLQAENANRASTGDAVFAMRLFQELKTSPGNLFFSPLSIRVALCMAYSGAAGKTAAEMQQLLAISGPNELPELASFLRHFSPP